MDKTPPTKLPLISKQVANPEQPYAPKHFTATETRFQGRYAKSLMETLYQAYRPFFGRTVVMLILGLLGRITLLGNTNLVGYWVDSFCQGTGGCRALPSIFKGLHSQDFLHLLMLATGVGFLFTWLYRVVISRLSAEAVSQIYDETTLRTSRLPMSFFDANPAGRVMTRFSSDYNNIFRIFGGPLAEFLGLVFDLMAMTVLITLASPWFLPFWLGLALLNYLVYRMNLTAMRRDRRESALKRSPGVAHFAESAQGVSTIRAFGRQANFKKRFADLNDASLIQRLKTNGTFAKFSISMSTATASVFLVMGLTCAWLTSTGRISIGAIGVGFAYLGLATVTMQAFFEWLGQFEEAMSGLERMNEYLRSPLEPGAKLPQSANFQTGHPRYTLAETQSSPITSTMGAPIAIRDLWMRYRSDLPAVLQGIEINIASGERLAVVGKTGSGKTSFVQALFRLYPIEKGSIAVGGFEAALNGNELQPLDLRKYRRQFSYITQDPTLFIGTLRDNLTNHSATQADTLLIQALQRVQFLGPTANETEYRGWLDHEIQERGRNLSAGERQLVCMARCLLQDSPVVILDEATSSVDPRSEEILTRATETFFAGKTQILIAHRLSTIRACDRVLWLQNGRVHRLGKPTEVLPEFETAELQA